MRLLRPFAPLCLVVAVLSSACSDGGRGPTSPSNAASPAGPVTSSLPPAPLNWECGRQNTNQTATSAALAGWTFETPAPACSSGRSTILGTDVAVGLVTVAPTNFRASVTGSTVRLDWDRVLEAVTTHQIEAGSAPGLSNLAVFNTGSAATTLTVNNVPAGVYYARVRAIGPDNVPGPPSNEITVSVGSCSGPPAAPTNLAAQITGNQVTLTWAPSGGNAASSYIVEAGSSSGQSNVVVFDTGNAASTLGATAPNGTYYVRLRGRNACGAGAASNEVIVSVPGGGTPPTADTPWAPPPGPEPPGPPPPVRTLVPEVQVSVPVIEPPRVVVGPAPRPDAGAGPPVDVSLIGSPTPTTRRLRVTSTTPVDTIVFAADTRVSAASVGNGTMAAAESYYLIRLTSAQTLVELTLTVAQSFTGQVAASRGGGPVGLYRAVPLTSSLGTGALRATLTWDTTADIDLHMIEPNGTHVYFASPTGSTATLDFDDTSGFGPENIFVASGAAAVGIYQVYINHYGGASPTTSTITITVNAGTPQVRSMTFTRTTTSSSPTVNVATVNVATGEIVGLASARLGTEPNEISAPKRP
jgi:Fibronectin type III domain/Uncharacterized protein conserved in bacteria (DUF2135)